MDDSLILARLTLMLLRASVNNPEGLPADHQVMLLPSHDPVSQSEALLQISRLPDKQSFKSMVDRGVLVIEAVEAVGVDRQSLEIGATNMDVAIENANRSNDPNALIRVTGFREEMFVSERVIRRWLWSMVCRQCSMSFGLPLSNEKAEIFGVLYLGSSSEHDTSIRTPPN